jgi:hypothetical protein
MPSEPETDENTADQESIDSTQDTGGEASSTLQDASPATSDKTIQSENATVGFESGTSSFSEATMKTLRKLAGETEDVDAESKKDLPKSEKPEQKDSKKEDLPKDETAERLTQEDKQFSSRVQKRISGLIAKTNELRQKHEDSEKQFKESPLYQTGQWMDNLIKDNKLQQYASTIRDEEFVDAIKFQGMLNRKASGQATDSDNAALKEYFNTFTNTARQLGFESSPQIDISQISTGIDAALTELSETLDVTKFVEKVKGVLASQVNKAPPKQPDTQKNTQQSNSDVSADEIFYSGKLIKDWSFLGDEVKDAPAAYQKFAARAIDTIRREMPGRNPLQFFKSLSVANQYEYLKAEIDKVRSERESKMPKRTPATQERVVRGTSSKGTSTSGKTPTQLAAERLVNWGD